MGVTDPHCGGENLADQGVRSIKGIPACTEGAAKIVKAAGQVVCLPRRYWRLRSRLTRAPWDG